MVEAAAVGLVFLLAGTVKGVIGLGLPTVSLGLLTALIGLEPAIALMLVPSFATNVWQAVVGGHFMTVLWRTRAFLLTATLTVWLGASLGAGIDPELLSGLLGMLLVAYGLFGIRRPPLTIPSHWEGRAGLIVGSANGLLTGLTGSFVVPGVPFLQSLALPRDQLVQAMGLLFTLSTVVLALALGSQGKLSSDLGFASVLAVLPAILGMLVGSRIRSRLDERAFRNVFLWSLIALGVYICGRASAELL